MAKRVVIFTPEFEPRAPKTSAHVLFNRLGIPFRVGMWLFSNAKFSDEMVNTYFQGIPRYGQYIPGKFNYGGREQNAYTLSYTEEQVRAINLIWKKEMNPCIRANVNNLIDRVNSELQLKRRSTLLLYSGQIVDVQGYLSQYLDWLSQDGDPYKVAVITDLSDPITGNMLADHVHVRLTDRIKNYFDGICPNDGILFRAKVYPYTDMDGCKKCSFCNFQDLFAI